MNFLHLCNSMYMKKNIFLIIFIISCFFADATHLVSAEIRLDKKPSVSSRTYDVVLTLFYLKASVEGQNVPLDVDSSRIDVRDAGRNILESFYISRDLSQNEVIDNGFSELVVKRVFVGQYTFAATNTSIILSYTGDQRRSGIENITDRPGLGDWEVYVETFVFVDGSATGNSTPELTTPPLGLAAKGQPYTYDIAAIDPEGDSLSYELVQLRYIGGDVIPEQWFPDDPKFGISDLTINPVTGILTWNAPQTLGLFNVALQVNEWRNGIRVSFSVRDFPIDVFESNNKVPIITKVRDTCVTTNQLLAFPANIVDPDGDRLTVDFSGSPKGLNPGATIDGLSGIGTSTINFEYNWIPGCDAIQATEHALITEAIDNGTPSLTSFEATLIKVYPEPPSNVSATFSNAAIKSVTLNWDAYPCNGQFNELTIYRSECDSTLDRSICDFKLPDEFGYVKVATIPASDTDPFIDDNNGLGLRGGVTYHYVITGKLIFPSVIEGPPSNIESVISSLDAPVITNVSVDSTSKTNGEIIVEWLKPIDFDEVSNPGPYTYELYRSQGLEGDAFGINPVFAFVSPILVDSSFQDTLLNTMDFPYAYQIKLISNTTNVAFESEFATSTWLETIPKARRIDLTWQDNSVWYRPDSLYQVVWQDILSDTIIDSLNTEVDYYQVENLTDGDTFCYYVETRNVFCVNELPEVYVNLSNIVCDVPLDTVPPCPPVLSIQVNDCETFDSDLDIKNELSISYDFDAPDCQDELSYYNIYFKKRPSDSFKFLESIPINSNPTGYIHDMISSYTYCYGATVVDIAGNESAISNLVCNDNCELFDLPNIFTPNEDGKNDLFTLYPDSRFVDKIVFKVYNRWGQQIYFSENDPLINWDGRSTKGEQVSDGIYYFSAEVFFDKLDQEGSKLDYKGWVMITR